MTDHPLVQALFHQQQLVTLALHQLGHRDAGGTGHHFGDFFGTHLGAQQARLAAVIGLFRLFGLRLLVPLFEFRQFPILKLGHLVELTLAGQFIDAKAHPIDFFLDQRAALGIGFFRFPYLFQIGIFLAQLDHLFLQQSQALLRGIVFFFSHRLTLNLELNQAPIQFIHHLGFGINFNFDFGRRLVNQVDGLVG